MSPLDLNTRRLGQAVVMSLTLDRGGVVAKRWIRNRWAVRGRTFGEASNEEDRARLTQMTAATLSVPTGVPVRLLMAVAFGLGLGFALYLMAANPYFWTDGEAYWSAAERLRAGAPLYLDTTTVDTYRYAPWFAWAWVPLTYLPKELVVTLWIGAMLACAVLACLPAWRHPWGKVAVAYSLPLLLVNAIGGNVQPALVAMLVWLPWSTGVAASLKPLALGLLVIDAWRRDWRKVAVGLALAAVLWAPALLYDLSIYPSPRGIGHYDFTLLLVVAVWLNRRGSAGSTSGAR